MSSFSADPAASATSPEDIAKMGKELEEFTHKMEAEGIKPEDLLKAILGEQDGERVVEGAKADRDRKESQSTKSQSAKSKSPPPTSSTSKPASFEDTIRRTMERMETSSATATSATQTQSTSEEDMLAEMLKALDSSASDPNSQDDLSKLFLGMMEQLTNRDMLYEPMKELNTKYPDWLKSNRSKLPSDEIARYERQKVIVKEIVDKFEEKGYTDEDPKCREFIWEKMQAMQGEGAPPEDLIANPLPGLGMPGMPGMGGGGESMEEGCPTQ